ncbi:MAG: hypothetical protein IKM32_00795, partial [Clostridia bacterium]|nr:hypothetical protein [Clostridia bacterium]
AVLRVCDLFCNDGEKRRNTNVFQGFLTKLQGKTVAQNRFLTVAHRPRGALPYEVRLGFIHLSASGIAPQ